MNKFNCENKFDYRPVVLLPLERWAAVFEECYSVHMMVAHDPASGKPVPVKAAPINGFLHTSSGSTWSAAADDCEFRAWPLIPRALFRGQTFALYHDETAIAGGLRDRGDLRGLIVAFRGREFVLGSPVNVRPSMPTAELAPSLAQAKALARARPDGWPTDSSSRWQVLAGFPVQNLPDGHPSAHLFEGVLYFRDGVNLKRVFLKSPAQFASTGDRSVLPVGFSREMVAQMTEFALGFPSSFDAVLPDDWLLYRAYFADDLSVDLVRRRVQLESLIASWSIELGLTVDRYDSLRDGGIAGLSAFEVALYEYRGDEAFWNFMTYQVQLFQSQLAIVVNLSLELEAFKGRAE